MTQADNRALRKLSNLRNSVAHTTLEPMSDIRNMQIRNDPQVPRIFKGDPSMNKTFNFSLMGQRKIGMEQYLDESYTKRTRASQDF